MAEEHRKRRSKSKRHKSSFIRHFSFEIFIAFIFFLGVFLLFEDMEIKTYVFQGVLNIFKGISAAFSNFLSLILGQLTIIETSDVVGSILILLAFLLLTYRARQKAILRYSDLSVCPECNSDLVHVHRNSLQKMTGSVLRLKIRRYRCKECSFDGIRIRPLHSR